VADLQTAEPLVPRVEADAPAEALAALRRAGAARIDPVRLHYLEVLAGRMTAAAPAVRQALQHRWQVAYVALDTRCRRALEAGVELAPVTAQTAGGPLTELNHYIRQVSRAATAAAAGADSGEDATELRSLRDFRATWGRIAAEDQVDAALARSPENAGPLNSHSLVVRSLALMRGLSPDYLRRFLSQVETLMALEQAVVRQREPAGKGKGRARAVRGTN